MVSKQTSRRKTLAPHRRSRMPRLVLSFIIVLIPIAILGLMINAQNTGEVTEEPNTEVVETSDPEPEPSTDSKEIAEINFQPIVDSWTQTTAGSKSILIYDLDLNKAVGSYEPETNYNTASLYKLFVVYEGYRRVQNGTWSADTPAGNTGYSVLKCLDLAIRESHSVCAEALWKMIGHKKLDSIIEQDFNIHDSEISGLNSNANDITKMMQIFYQHTEITDEKLIAQMQDSFLNQSSTDGYNWRQGLPSGFTKAKVYNKVGWDYNADDKYWNIYHDAAIIEFPEENRHFVVVAMTSRVPYQQIAKLGSMIEMTYYQ